MLRTVSMMPDRHKGIGDSPAALAMRNACLEDLCLQADQEFLSGFVAIVAAARTVQQSLKVLFLVSSCDLARCSS